MFHINFIFFTSSCNDYAFEFNLADHCLDLILHFGKIDSAQGVELQKDVADAATILLSAASRSCDAYFGLHTEHWQSLVDSKVCLTTRFESYSNQIDDLLRDNAKNDSNAYFHVLRSYIDIDASSLVHFERAVSLDETMFRHGVWLSERLAQKGRLISAIAVLELTIKTADSIRENDLINAERLDFYDTTLQHVLHALRKDGTFYRSDDTRHFIKYDN